MLSTPGTAMTRAPSIGRGRAGAVMWAAPAADSCSDSAGSAPLLLSGNAGPVGASLGRSRDLSARVA